MKPPARPDPSDGVSPAHGYKVITGTHAPDSVNELLRLLPDWFGIEESILGYVEDARSKETYLAVDSEQRVRGVLLASHHNEATAEIHLLAVHPDHHRRGLGTMLVTAFEEEMRSRGFRLLEVKTQGPSQPDVNYAATLQFYLALGYLPLEEIHGYWPGLPCLILVKAVDG